MQTQPRHKLTAVPKRAYGTLLKNKLGNFGPLNKNPHDVSNEPRDAWGRWIAEALGSLIPSAGAAEMPPVSAPAKTPGQSKNQGKNSAPPKPFPSHWDAKVDKYVSAYNEKYGFKPGDKEYLDPNLIKAMIKVESAYDMKAYNSDPMQVNKPGDWDDKDYAKSVKFKFGLREGVAPGSDLSIQAGIKWLRYKAYEHDDAGRAFRFRGWKEAVHRYNYNGKRKDKGNHNYVEEVFALCSTCSQ